MNSYFSYPLKSIKNSRFSSNKTYKTANKSLKSIKNTETARLVPQSTLTKIN